VELAGRPVTGAAGDARGLIGIAFRLQNGQFESIYQRGILRESAFWTAHESRLARNFGTTRFGSEGYAIEELVAELCRAADYAARRWRVPR